MVFSSAAKVISVKLFSSGEQLQGAVSVLKDELTVSRPAGHAWSAAHNVEGGRFDSFRYLHRDGYV